MSVNVFNGEQLSGEQFKTLIFVAGLTSTDEADIRTRLLAKLDTSPQITIQDLTDEYLHMISLKRDSAMVESASHSRDVASVDRIASNVYRERASRFQRPPSACWHCGQWHFARFCKFRNYVCQTCDRVGHKEVMCRQSSRATRVRHQSNIVYSTNSGSFPSLRKFITIHLDRHPVKLQIDTA